MVMTEQMISTPLATPPSSRRVKIFEELLPPTEDVLLLHIKRSNYQAYIWRHSMGNFLNMPDPRIHGWVFNGQNDDLEVRGMSLPLALDRILCFVNCFYAKGCSTARCCCKKASFIGCSDLSRCKECQNNSLETKEEELKELEDQWLCQ